MGRVGRVATRPRAVQGEKAKGSTGGSPGIRARPWNKNYKGTPLPLQGRRTLAARGREPPPRQDWKQKMGTEEGAKELRAAAEAKTGPCLVCKEKHVYQRKLPWGSLQWPSDRLQECKAFQALSPPQRAKVIQEQGGCVVCMSWAHTKARFSGMPMGGLLAEGTAGDSGSPCSVGGGEEGPGHRVF